jgi:hypothetical protein
MPAARSATRCALAPVTSVKPCSTTAAISPSTDSEPCFDSTASGVAASR